MAWIRRHFLGLPISKRPLFRPERSPAELLLTFQRAGASLLNRRKEMLTMRIRNLLAALAALSLSATLAQPVMAATHHTHHAHHAAHHKKHKKCYCPCKCKHKHHHHKGHAHHKAKKAA